MCKIFKDRLFFILSLFSIVALISCGVSLNNRELFAQNIFDDSETDSCGNGLGNGNELIPGPPGPEGPDFDQVFRSLTVDPKDPDTIFVGTERNGIFKSVDGGTTWQWLRCGLRNSDAGYPEVWDITISPLGSDDAVFAATLDSPGPVTDDFPSSLAGVYKSTDGGLSWQRSNCGLVNSRAVSIRFDPENANTLILGVEGGTPSFNQLEGEFFDGGLFKSIDKGATWKLISISSNSNKNGYWHLYARSSNPLEFYTFGLNFNNLDENLGFLKSSDKGESWLPFADELRDRLIWQFDVSSDGKVIYANIRDGFEILKSIDNGETWETINSPQANGMIKVSPADSNTLLFENSGNLHRSIDGLNSTSLVLSAGSRMNDIEFAPSNPDIVYVAEEGYNIYRSSDGGSTFTLVSNLRTDVMLNDDTVISPCTNSPLSTSTPVVSPTPTDAPSPIATETPSSSPVPEVTVTPLEGKQFIFNCNRQFVFGAGRIEKLVLKIGESEQCLLKLTNFKPGIKVEISTKLRKGNSLSTTVKPENGVTDSNGELEFTITAINEGIDWLAWAVPDENGKVEFTKESYDSGLAWGVFVEVK